MKLFDIQSVLFARHAQHVVIVHFPIALFVASYLFDWLALRSPNRVLLAAAHANHFAAVIAAPLAVITGILAWQWQLAGARLRGVLLLHLIFALSSTVLIWFLWWLRPRLCGEDLRATPFYLGIGGVAVAMIAIAAHLGGIVSGVITPGM
jgi:uncharacterized membrane protein